MNGRLAMLGVATLMVLVGHGCVPPPEVDPKPVHKGQVCQEDDECWDCHADGDGICGTDLGA